MDKKKTNKEMKGIVISTLFMVLSASSIFSMSVVSEFPICTAPHRERYPAIYGDIVAFVDQRSGNWDIYGVNLSTGTEFPICTALHRNGNWDIYGVNLSKGTEFPIKTDLQDQWKPEIYGNIVVFADHKGGINWDICGVNLSTGTEFPICTHKGYQTWPAI
jgi:beta propeller repeat protein